MSRINVGLLYVKSEVSAGVDQINGVLTGLKPIFALVPAVYEPEADEIQRQILDGRSLMLASDIKILRGKLTFSMELRGNRTDGIVADVSSGLATKEPETDLLLKACDLNPVYTAETGLGLRNGTIEYQPVNATTQGATLTMYLYYAQKLHKLTGCKGTFSMAWGAGDFIRAQFEFRGVYLAVVDNPTLPTVSSVDFPALLPPRWASAGSNLSYGGGTMCLAALNVDLGNELAIRHCPNMAAGFSGYLITDRKMTAEIDPEDDLEANRPDWARWAAQSSLTLTASAGNISQTGSGPPPGVTGNRIVLTAAAQIASLKYDNRGGIITKRISMRIVRSLPGNADGAAFSLLFG